MKKLDKKIVDSIFFKLDPYMFGLENDMRSIRKVIAGIYMLIGALAYVCIQILPTNWLAGIILVTILVTAITHFIGKTQFTDENRLGIQEWKEARKYLMTLKTFQTIYRQFDDVGVESSGFLKHTLGPLKLAYQSRLNRRAAVFHGRSDFSMPGTSFFHRH